MAFGLTMLIVGDLGAELFLARTSFVVIVAGLILSFFGGRHFRILLLPLLALFLMVPIPIIVFNQITLPLQFLASKFASALLPLVGVPVFREGNIIILAHIELEVAQACSGIRSLLTLATLALMYGYFLERNNKIRLALLCLAFPIAVIANAFRIFATGVLVNYWDAEKAMGFFHEFSGWVIFVASFVALLISHRVIHLVLNTRNSDAH